ncbi:MAG: isoprenylcysteine carboxylmethyltransferase family protein [Terracidiphilus sp.]|jgi:protein-S-isoprenylcysteine O-methyltransferase Ste14
MKATAFEFRLRVAIMVIVIFLGFWAPWIELWGIGSRIPLLDWLPLQLSRLGLLSFSAAVPVVIVLVALTAAKAAALRIWGPAYLGPATVNNFQMKASAVLADGPYRYVRNPLYLGSWGVMAAIAFLMPPTGALFVMILLTVFLLRLIFAEEAFLTNQLGEPYRAYLHSVPRLIPRLRTTLPSTGRKPHWLRAAIAEINPIGIFLIFAIFSWSYNNRLMVRAVLISFGISLVVRALLPAISQSASPAE